MLLKRGNWVGNTTRPPLWTIHKSFGQRLQISKTEYIPVIWTIFGLQSHTLFTNRGETRIQAIKLTPRFADTSNSWEAGELRSHFLPATGEPDEGAVDSSHFQAREVSSSQNSVQMWRDFRLVGILQRRCQTGPDWTAVSGRCCAWHFIDIAYSWWLFRFATQTGRAKKVTRARCRGAVFKRAPELIYYFFFWKGGKPKICRRRGQNAVPRYSSGFGGDGSGSWCEGERWRLSE